ncbi:MAG TPA: MFS transporter, partial [Synergistales bacterium]|nr:MFS transporter [Synergistales bacterium]
AFLAVFMLYPSVLRDQGFSLGLSGWLMSVFNLCSTLGRPLGARATERLGIRTTLLWTSGLVAVFTMPLAFTEHPLLLLFLRGTGGVFWGISMVAISSYQGLSIPAARRGSAYAWIAVAYVFPQVTLFPLADWFASSRMLTAYFLLAAAVEAAIVLVAAPLPPLRRAESSQEEPKEWGRWSELPSLPGFRAVLATMFLFAFVNASTLQYLPAFLSMRGYSPSVFIVPNAMTAIALRLVAFRIMDRIDRRRVIGSIIAAMGFILAFLPFAPGRGWYVAGGLFYGVVMGMCFPIVLALMPDLFPERLRPKGISLCLFAIDLGFILSPFFLGYGGQIFGLGRTLSVTGVLGLLGGALLHFAWNGKKRAEP